MPVKLIASDMDGTLLMDDHATISKRSTNAIREAIRRGIPFVPISSRMLNFLMEPFSELPEIRYVITSNGAVCYDLESKTQLFSVPIAQGDLLEILENLADEEHLLELHYDNTAFLSRKRAEYLKIHGLPERLLQFVEKKQIVVDSLSELVRHTKPSVEKINFPYLLPGERDRIWEKIKHIQGICMSSSGPQNLEINHKNANKGTALRALCDHLGISIADTIAFGDGNNDCEMLREAGIGVAMANAKEEIQRAADHVTLTNEQDGVAVFLEQHLQG